MQEKDKDLAEPVISIEDNAVRVMTIHASKGLEFPSCIFVRYDKGVQLTRLAQSVCF